MACGEMDETQAMPCEPRPGAGDHGDERDGPHPGSGRFVPSQALSVEDTCRKAEPVRQDTLTKSCFGLFKQHGWSTATSRFPQVV